MWAGSNCFRSLLRYSCSVVSRHTKYFRTSRSSDVFGSSFDLAINNVTSMNVLHILWTPEQSGWIIFLHNQGGISKFLNTSKIVCEISVTLKLLTFVFKAWIPSCDIFTIAVKLGDSPESAVYYQSSVVPEARFLSMREHSCWRRFRYSLLP